MAEERLHRWLQWTGSHCLAAACYGLLLQYEDSIVCMQPQVAEERVRGWLQWADSHEEQSGDGAANAQVAFRH